MRCRAIATDYDGTLAENGAVRGDVMDALARVKASGRAVILVTGRQLGDLRRVCPDLDVFDEIVAENGAVLVARGDEASSECPICEAPPAAFAALLEERGIPVSCGRVVVATKRPHDVVIQQVIRERGLGLEVVFNKHDVMVLPAGVSKATGLARALERLGISAESVVAVGDAENDHVLLETCGIGVAVANAVESLKLAADLVTRGARGDGVRELVDRILATDLRDVHRVRAAS